jgi:hypothetical protein
MGYAIEYWSNEVSERNSVTLVVPSGQPSRLIVESNADTPGASPVGLFEAAPPSTALQVFLDAVGRLVSEPQAVLPPVPPGSKAREIRASTEGKKAVVRRAVDRGATALAFLQAERAALALAQGVRKHPKAALSTTVRFSSSQPEYLDIQIEFRNVGSDTVRIPCFLSPNHAPLSFDLNLSRNDIPPGEFISGIHQHFHDLSSKELVGSIPDLENEDKLVAIAPGQVLTMQFRARLALPNGSYDAILTLDTSLLDEKGMSLIPIESVSETFLWRVGGPPEKR